MAHEYRTVKSSRHVIGTISRKAADLAVRRMASKTGHIHAGKSAATGAPQLAYAGHHSKKG